MATMPYWRFIKMLVLYVERIADLNLGEYYK